MGTKRLFAATSILFLIVLAISPAKNALRPYRALQRQYRRLGLDRAKSLKAAREYEPRPAAIQQLWLRDFDNRVDRCTTCHLGVADAAMRDAAEPFRTHVKTTHTPDGFDRFGCTPCHGGQGLATSWEQAHGTGRDAGPPMLPLIYVEAGCGRCHAAETVRDAPLLSRGRALMARSGCYACHAVRGHESFRSEAPPLTTIALKTGGTWLRKWLANPREVDPNATMPNFRLAPEEIEELAQYLFSRSVAEDLARRIQAASLEPPGDPAGGKKVFSEARCISCHTLEGKGNGSAPELSRIASAANRGWLLAFLRDPQAFHPRTRMPRYHFSDAESRDVVAYMEEDLRDFDAPQGSLDPIRVNQTLAERGEKTFRKYVPDWLEAKLEDPRSFAQGLKMPSFGFDAEDRRAVVTALLSLAEKPVPESYRNLPARAQALLPGGPVGEMIGRYRCLSCHQIGDRGGDVSTAPLTYEGSKVKRDWLVDYLVLSYSLRPVLEERMPVFRMPREEAAQIADALENFYLDPSIPEDPFAGRAPADGDPVAGQRLYVTLGCRACHIIADGGGYYGPPLTDTSRRLKPGWIYTWLKGPQRWRADVRCPDYGLNDTEALRLTAYLGTLRQTAQASGGGTR